MPDKIIHIASRKGFSGTDRIFQDRKRTNVLRSGEQKLIVYLVKRVPAYVTSNMLTLIGAAGSLIVLIAFILAAYTDVRLLLLGIAGLAINWLGDSLDGRLAYFRNIPRKWYGFALDIIMDWIGTVLIGLGYLIYAPGNTYVLAFAFVVLYAWAMIISQLRYKITGHYAIDSGPVGPTELRVLIAAILVAEIVYQGSIAWFAGILTLVLLLLNILDTNKLLKMGDSRDKREQSGLGKDDEQ